jgi:hypothetical protein
VPRGANASIGAADLFKESILADDGLD